uniref:Uncharacterized protein n=1 Tax=Tanacetum cinerariifolium TaxID=118510 RepID=A0A6L2NLJ0_TANCI|nr:hypothetical protein [Tanacetum cinerariifolium]
MAVFGSVWLGNTGCVNDEARYCVVGMGEEVSNGKRDHAVSCVPMHVVNINNHIAAYNGHGEVNGDVNETTQSVHIVVLGPGHNGKNRHEELLGIMNPTTHGCNFSIFQHAYPKICARGFGLFGLFVHGVIINRGFLDSGGRKSNHTKKTDTVTGASSTMELVETLNDATPLVDSVEKEVVSLSVVDETMAKEKQSPLVNTTGLGSFPPLPTQKTTVLGFFPPLPTQVTTSAGNAPGKGNGIDVVVSVESIQAISKPFAKTAYGFFLGKRVAYPIVANYNNPLIMKKWHPDENLLKEDISNVPVWVNFYGVLVTAFNEDGLSAIATKLGTPLMLDSYTSNICMQYWGRSSYARVMIELQASVELKDNIVMAIPKITREGHYIFNIRVNAGEKKTVKKPSQTSRGVSVGLKMSFKPQKEYRPVPKKSTASSSSNKKKGVEPTNKGLLIWKFKELLTSGQAILVDEASNPLKKVEFLFEYDSEDEVVSVDNNMARSIASERVGHDLTQELQAICDTLDIRVRDRKKK